MEEDLITAAFGPMGRRLRRLHSLEASSSDLRLPEGISADEIRFLTEGLEGLYNHLKDLPEADLGASFTPRWWIKEVRELAYDTEDYFDEVLQSGADAGAVVRRSARLSTISRITSSKRKQSRPKIAQGFSELMARVDDARERCKSFQLPPEPDRGQASISRPTPERSIDLPVLAAPISDFHMGIGCPSVVGVEEPIKKLVNLLAFGEGNQKQLKVVPIFGPSGVGKTIVARTLYHQYGGEFQCRAFIRVSRNPDMRRLLTSIISQVKAPQAHTFSDAQDLIDSIIKHLKGKRYFIIVDDLWTALVWDIISRAFPYGDCCSRILTTTQIEDVALACSGYKSEYIFKMGPLNDSESRKLFFDSVFGSEGEGGCPKEFEIVADGIIRKCGGLPLSTVHIASLLLPSKPNLVMEQWKKVECSLPSTLRKNPSLQGMKDVLILIYNKLSRHLKTCLLSLSMYPEGYTIRKDDLVKQWAAESFVGDTEHGYFDELVRRGMLQPVDTNYHGEVLSCTVNHMVLDLIRYKSMEDNFIIAVNCFDSTLGVPDKVRRLSIQFGGAKSAKILESIRMSQVRSLVFCGFSKCLPSILDYRLLQVLILYMWGDQDETSFNLTRVGELFRLRYLKIECDITVDLPEKIEGLKCLETLHVDAKLSAVPSDIGLLKKLLHLRLPSDAILPYGFARMTSLCTLGYFDLSSNSEDNVGYLGELKNLQDLQLTCCMVESADSLESNMKCRGSVLGKLKSLRCLTLVPSAGSSNVNTDLQEDAGSSSMNISCDGLSSVSTAPVHLQRLELSRRSCIFSSLPKWIGGLSKLCILKIAIRELSREDIENLKGLPALIALSLYIFQTSPTERIIFGKEGFPVLRYFKFWCSAPWLKFNEDAMPNLHKLKLGFNAPMGCHHNTTFISIDHLSGLKEISAKIWGGAGAPVESILTTAIRNHPGNPKINGQLVNWNSCGEIQMESPDNCYRTQHGSTGEDEKKQVDSRIPMKSGSSSHLPVSDN